MEPKSGSEAYVSLDDHIAELERWRANRLKHNYEVRTLDRALQVAKAYKVAVTWYRTQRRPSASVDPSVGPWMYLGFGLVLPALLIGLGILAGVIQLEVKSAHDNNDADKRGR